VKLTLEQTYGWIDGKRFVVFKEQKHILKVHNGFGCSEHRLRAMIKEGVNECRILFCKEDDSIILYRTTPHDWVHGPQWKNKNDVQRIIPIEECEIL